MAGNKTSVIKRKFQLSCAAKRGSVSRGIHNGEGGKWGPSSQTVNSILLLEIFPPSEKKKRKRERGKGGGKGKWNITICEIEYEIKLNILKSSFYRKTQTHYLPIEIFSRKTNECKRHVNIFIAQGWWR